MRKSRDWSNIIRAWQASGLSAQAYCRENKLPSSSFWQWRKRLANAAYPEELMATEGKFIDVTPNVAKLVEKPVSMLRIILPSGCQIEVPI